MANTQVITDEVMEFLKSEVFNAYASGDVLSYTAKDGTEYALRVSQVFGSDDPEFNDGFHAFAAVLLDENGDETDQSVLVTRGISDYQDSYADMDDNACGWSLFMAHKDEVLAWYNDQKDAGKEVSFTGISLGGALSQMFAGFIHQETGDTLKSVVTFSAPGIEKSVTYEGVTYDFSGTIAETVHHYLDSGDVLAELGSYYIEGDVYLYGNNYYLDQAGDGGEVVRFKDYIAQPHAQVKYLLSDEYSAAPQAVFIKEMDSSDMTGSWNPLSVTVDETPEGIENTNNAIVTVGDTTYVFNKAYAEIVLSMGVSGGAVDINYASKYVSRQKWEEMRSTEEGRQDFLGTALIWDWTTDVNVGISGSFTQGGKDYAVITLTGKTEQGKEFLYSFSDGCFLETEEVVSGGDWQNIAGAQTYTVEFDELPGASESSGEQSENSQNKTYSTEVTNEMIEAIKDCTTGEHQIGDVFEYTSQAGLTYRLKFTELYGSDDPEMNDGFHAAGLVLLDTDGVTETDEHFLVFRATSGFPDAIADFYKDVAGLPLFAAHTQDVLDWYEKYEGEKITFSGSSLGSALAQYFAGWLVNDEGKDKLTRLVAFLATPIIKEATYEDTTYHFITDETVAETVEFYRHSGDILGGLGQDYQKGTLHLYGGNAQLDQAEGVKLHEYLASAHMVGTYLKGGTSALTYLGDFDTDYFGKDANYSDLAVEVDAVPEGLENTNVEAVTCGDKIYLFNTEYADVALTVVSYNMTNYDETLEDFFEDASLYTCRNKWEECRGSDKQEALARLMMYNNTSDIEISTGRGLTLGGKDYVELANTGSSLACNFFFNFTDREFVAGNDLASDSTLGEVGGVTFSVGDDAAAVALAGEVVTVKAEKVAEYYFTGFTSDEVTISGDEFTMPEADVTVTANYAQCVITITADSDSKTYDGTELTKNSYTYSTDGTLKAGDVLTATVEGSITDAGTADNVVTSYKVMRGEEDVTSEYKFNDCVKGTLTVTQRELTVTGTTADGKTYDGNTDAVVHLGTVGNLVDGDDVTVTAAGTFDTKDAENGKDVAISYTLTGAKAANYTVTGGTTIADIEKRNVTLTSADATKEYDGTALTCDTVTVSGDGWAAGEGATYTVTGSQTEVGSSANTFTYTLNANTTAGNYDVTTQEGTLTVTPASTVCSISNYNNTAKSDIVQITPDGKVYVTMDNGTGYVQSAEIYDITGWAALETRRDINGDTLADVQIAGSDGIENHTAVAILRNDFDGSSIQLNYQLIRAYDNNLWEYAGAADVNGDGKDETLLVQTTLGSDNGYHHVCAWTTDDNGAYQVDQDVWVGSYHIGWAIAGTADVDGNGTDNIILRRADGQICYWSETGTNDLVRVWYSEGSNYLTSADFSGSGKDGILWNNAAGDFFAWSDLDGDLVDVKIGNVSELGGNWSFAGAGDYDGDGADEILWCDGAACKMAYSEANQENFANLKTIA